MKPILVKSILNKKKKRDTWFLDEYTLNPFEGCSFNCQYCYIRGSKYGENMDDTLAIKTNALEVLDRQLTFRARKQQYGIIALASATDPYLRAEADQQITRGMLQLIHKHRFPVLLITKSPHMLRDIDLLQQIDRDAILPPDLAHTLGRGAIVSFSLSTLDTTITATLEPGAPPPQQRLDAMQQCAEAGLLTGVNAMPVLPFISDTAPALDHIIQTAAAHKAHYILVGSLTLFGNKPADSKVLYYKFLERTYPHLVPEYKKLYRIFFAPPKSYLQALEERAHALSQKHHIRNRILAHA